MRLTKRQLKRIIREEYSRLQKQGLIKEGINSAADQGIPAELAALEKEHDDILFFMNGQAQSGNYDAMDMRGRGEQVCDLEEEMHLMRKEMGLPPKDYIAYSANNYFHAMNTILGRMTSYRRNLQNV